MKRKSKWLAIFVSVAMLLSLLPTGIIVSAAGETEIATAEQLQAINTDTTTLNGNYILTADIPISGDAWTPIGTVEKPFTGTFNGGGHTITYNLTFSSDTIYYAGLFGYSTGTLKNINITGSNITLSSAKTRHVGLIAGHNEGTIESCSAINSTIQSSGVRGNEYCIGAIAGYNGKTSTTTGTITKCYSTSDIFISNKALLALMLKVGGIAGNNEGQISSSYSTGTVTAEAEITGILSDFTAVASFVGGITGYNNNAITNCYSAGNLASATYNKFGGFLGTGCAGGIAGKNTLTGSISYTYSASMLNGYYAGGIAGMNQYQAEVTDESGTVPEDSGEITNSYFIQGSSSYKYIRSDGDLSATDGILSTSAMTALSNFAGFSGDNWEIVTESPDYPFPTLKGLTHIERANNTTDFAGGNGTIYNPYQIANSTQLDNIRDSKRYMASCYILTSDILFTDWDFNSQAENAALFEDITASKVVDDDEATTATAVDLTTDLHITTLAELVASGKLPTAILINEGSDAETYAPITDWTGTFNGTAAGTYVLTPVWSAPAGYNKGAEDAPTFNVTVTTTQTESLTSAIASDPVIASSFTNEITLSADENITTLQKLIASGKLPTIVQLKEGSDPYYYRWWKIDSSTWSGTFDGTQTGDKTLTTVVNSQTVTMTIKVNTAQTAAITTPQDGDFYNGGLGWIPIGVSVAGNKYTGDVESFKGVLSGSYNDGETQKSYNIYNLQINADASGPSAEDTDDVDAYAGLFGVNNGLILYTNISNVTSSTVSSGTLTGLLQKLGNDTLNLFKNILSDTSDYSGAAIVTTSKNAYAGMIAGKNNINGKISNVQVAGEITAQANKQSYAGGIAGINNGYIANAFNYAPVTSNSKAVNARAGGISGSNVGYIQNCANTGKVIAGYGTAMTPSLAQAYSSSKLYAGGITGENSETIARIKNSHNIGGVRTQITSALSADDDIYVGGIAGYVADSFSGDTPSITSIDADSSYWSNTAPFCTENAAAEISGYSETRSDTFANVKSDIQSIGTLADYENQTFISFAFPATEDGSYTGEFGSESAPGAYVDSISTSAANFYDNNGVPYVLKTINSTEKGTPVGGYQLMKVTYSATGATNETVEFITHYSAIATGLSVIATGATTKYFVGQDIDTTGLEITATFAGGDQAISPEDCTITAPDMSTAGTGKTVTVTYDSNGTDTGGVVTAEYTIDVYAVDSISLNTDSVQKDFTVNSTFNSDGLIVTATNTAASYSAVIDNADCTISKPIMSSTGAKTVTVTYQSKTATYDINVNKPSAPTLLSVTASGTSITLNWTKADDATGYIIYRGTKSSELKDITTKVTTLSSNDILTYINTGLSQNTTYYYTIYSYAVNSSATSDASNVVSAKTEIVEITAKSGSGYTANQSANTLTGVRTRTSVADLQSGLDQTVRVFSGSTEVTGGNVGTGMQIRLYNGTTLMDTLTVVVKGDTSGDGEISITDLLQIKKHILGSGVLSTVYFQAGNVDGSGDITITDLLQIKSHLLSKIILN